MTYLKFLCADGTTPYAHYPWPDDAPALPGVVVQCEHGYHFCLPEQAGQWIRERVAEIAPSGGVVNFGDKCATTSTVHTIRQGTFDMVAFARWCAERANQHADAAAADAAAAYAAAAADADAAAERQAQGEWILTHIIWDETAS